MMSDLLFVMFCGGLIGLFLGKAGYRANTWRFWLIAAPLNILVVTVVNLTK